MSRPPIHEPPPPLVIAALVRAGLSQSTANAMEAWKAHEVLDLLRASVRTDPNSSQQRQPVVPFSTRP